MRKLPDGCAKLSESFRTLPGLMGKARFNSFAFFFWSEQSQGRKRGRKRDSTPIAASSGDGFAVPVSRPRRERSSAIRPTYVPATPHSLTENSPNKKAGISRAERLRIYILRVLLQQFHAFVSVVVADINAVHRDRSPFIPPIADYFDVELVSINHFHMRAPTPQA
jgi:hypothetical protein